MAKEKKLPSEKIKIKKNTKKAVFYEVVKTSKTALFSVFYSVVLVAMGLLSIFR